tara:strand:+ start:506 stop:706 length:201 start_codon:yes stop_codon:yes gene_type:complete
MAVMMRVQKIVELQSYSEPWLTNSGRSKNRSGKPQTGIGPYVWTEDGAHQGAKDFPYYEIEPDQCR